MEEKTIWELTEELNALLSKAAVIQKQIDAKRSSGSVIYKAENGRYHDTQARFKGEQ